MPKHRWTQKEEENFCDQVIVEYVLPKTSWQDFLDEAEKYFPEIERGSLQMKLSNIKALLDAKGVPNTLNISKLTNASKQNEKALEKCLDFFEIKHKKNTAKKVASKLVSK